jgi:phosphatidylserine/phosphatidylglycerophosphate/cardiolipin synthase-like enzyme
VDSRACRADKITAWGKVSDRLTRKNSLPYDRNKPHQPHNFMHNKLVIADDVAVTGSSNLSNHAMGNAESVLLIRDADMDVIFNTNLQSSRTENRQTKHEIRWVRRYSDKARVTTDFGRYPLHFTATCGGRSTALVLALLPVHLRSGVEGGFLRGL